MVRSAAYATDVICCSLPFGTWSTGSVSTYWRRVR